MNVLEFTERVGERIQEWIEESLTHENGCKRKPDEDDLFEEGEMSWMFTQKGERLYRSYLSKANRLIEKKYPNELLDDLERYTGVIYP